MVPGMGGFGGGRGDRGGAGRSRRRMAVRMMRRRRRRRILLVGGLLAFGAYKMSKSDADKIQKHTGKDPEDMTDAEIERAMDDLNIEKQYRDASDQEAVGNTQTTGQSDEPSYLDELERLDQLRNDGIITDEEFEAKKKQLLGL